jgi:hypothetical protein
LVSIIFNFIFNFILQYWVWWKLIFFVFLHFLFIELSRYYVSGHWQQVHQVWLSFFFIAF